MKVYFTFNWHTLDIFGFVYLIIFWIFYIYYMLWDSIRTTNTTNTNHFNIWLTNGIHEKNILTFRCCILISYIYINFTLITWFISFTTVFTWFVIIILSTRTQLSIKLIAPASLLTIFSIFSSILVLHLIYPCATIKYIKFIWHNYDFSLI